MKTKIALGIVAAVIVAGGIAFFATRGTNGLGASVLDVPIQKSAAAQVQSDKIPAQQAQGAACQSGGSVFSTPAAGATYGAGSVLPVAWTTQLSSLPTQVSLYLVPENGGSSILFSQYVAATHSTTNGTMAVTLSGGSDSNGIIPASVSAGQYYLEISFALSQGGSINCSGTFTISAANGGFPVIPLPTPITHGTLTPNPNVHFPSQSSVTCAYATVALATPATQIVSVVTTGFEFTDIKITAPSNCNVTLDQLEVIANEPTTNVLANLQVYNGATQIGSTVASPTTANYFGSAAYPLGIAIPAGTSVTLKFKADVIGVGEGAMMLGISGTTGVGVPIGTTDQIGYGDGNKYWGAGMKLANATGTSCLPNQHWIKVVSPNGGEVVSVGQTIQLQWEACNVISYPSSNVATDTAQKPTVETSLDLSTTNYEEYEIIANRYSATSTDGTLQSVNWTIPYIGAMRDINDQGVIFSSMYNQPDVKFRIVGGYQNGSGGFTLLSDESDNYFQINYSGTDSLFSVDDSGTLSFSEAETFDWVNDINSVYTFSNFLFAPGIPVDNSSTTNPIMFVEYGTDSTLSGTNVVRASEAHNAFGLVTVTGLTPNTLYYERFCVTDTRIQPNNTQCGAIIPFKTGQ